MTSNPQTAVAVIDQGAETGVVEWNLDEFPTNRFNRLVPVSTLQLPTDLLRPVVQIVQLNPDPKAGDVYHSDDMPAGQSAPTRVGLRKFATAAGISFIDERRVDDGRDPDVIEMLSVAEMLLPTGQRIRAVGSKRIDLNAQKWASDNHRAKYKSFFQEHVASRAQNRAIRALLSLRGSYPTEIYHRPFAVVSFAPNMAHPEVRARILDSMAGASAQLYGPAAARQLAPGEPINVTPAPEDDPAPATPTVMPGERLAAAAQPAGDEEPDWMRQADPAAATSTAAGEPAEPGLITAIRDSAAASKLKGAITDAQKARIAELLRGVGGFQAITVAAFGAEAFNSPTSGQANAIIVAADSFESVEAFRAAWVAAADVIKAEAA